MRSFIDANPRRAHKRPLRQIIITITQLDLSKTVSALQDDNHKSRGSALALTMEIESVRERLGGEKERLEDQVDELKGKLSKADAERQRLFLDNEDMRRMVNSKDANCNNVAAELEKTKKELGNSKLELSKHIKTGVQAVHDARDHGFAEGREEAREEMRETVSKMNAEVKEMVEEIAEAARSRESMKEEMMQHDKAFAEELESMHKVLDAREDEIVQLKNLLGEKEASLYELRRNVSVSDSELDRFSSKHEFEMRGKDEVINQYSDEVERLKQRVKLMQKDLDSTEERRKQQRKEDIRRGRRKANDMKRAVSIVK